MEVLDILFNDITKPSSKNYSFTDFQKFLQIRSSSTTNFRKMRTLNTPLIYHNAASNKSNLTDARHEEGHWQNHLCPNQQSEFMLVEIFNQEDNI